MNKLALAIRKLNDETMDLEACQLASLEFTALHSIGNLLKMSSVDLAIHLYGEGDPTDWLINPLASSSTKAAT